MRALAVLMLALIGCGGSYTDERVNALTGAPGTKQDCDSLSHAYALAVQEARACDPAAADPCGGRAYELLESLCVIGVAPEKLAEVDAIADQYRAAGCPVGPPAPCPLRTRFTCEQAAANPFLCAGRP